MSSNFYRGFCVLILIVSCRDHALVAYIFSKDKALKANCSSTHFAIFWGLKLTHSLQTLTGHSQALL